MESADSVSEKQVAQYLLVYSRRSEDTAWWARLVHRDFTHIEIWWALGEGFYVAIRPYHHYLVADVMQGEPEGVVQPVTALRKHTTSMFPAGLKTCVSVAKAVIGVRAPWIITPRQLYRYVAARNGVV